MTLVSAVLLVLRPSPVAPLSHIQLLSTDQRADPADQLFDTAAPSDQYPWNAVVVSLSGNDYGSLETVSTQHQRMGLGGLGYHFVIGNGTGSPDGQIEVGFRWLHQWPAALPGILTMPDSHGDRAIHICLIGDGHSPPTASQMRELTWLTQRLQARLGIDYGRVRVVEAGPYAVGDRFPVTQLRQALYR